MKSIAETAAADGRFTTLLAAAEAAGLSETLATEGPLTVFAPTDDAFAKLPDGTVEALLENVPVLTDILLYHVAAGKLMAEDVAAHSSIDTLLGLPVDVKLEDDGSVYLNDAQVLITDIEATNGVIHVIDTVLLPPEEEMEMPDLVDIAAADGRFTTLVAALQQAGLVDALRADTPITVFAPTDDAFGKLPDGTVEGLLENVPALTDILLYHVVPGKVMAADVVTLESADTLLGKPVSIAVEEDGSVMINESMVLITDIEGSNGVIHVIDSVLLPPAEEEPMAEAPTLNIVELAVADGRFTTLVSAVQKAELADDLMTGGPYTVFAPTDDAFAALPEGTLDAVVADFETLNNVILYHLVPGVFMAESVAKETALGTVLGQPLSVAAHSDGTVTVNDSQIVITDIPATNGVIHVIDAVLIPEAPAAGEAADIVDAAVADGRFTTLVTAVQEAGLVEVLKGVGPFTVFAPTDDAFGQLPEGTVEALLGDIPTLTKILAYHVTDGKLMSGDVVQLETISTLSGDPLTVTVDGDKVMINDSQVVIVDVETSNGVIHVIDAVLLPPSS
jgi:transforming growth factor-beta-induced protein